MLAITSEQERRALDAVARDVLRTLTGLEFRTATSPEEVDATFRLRYEAVVANGWARPEDHPDGRERDADDEHAVCVVCLDGGRVVGCLRLVKPSLGRLLPAERDFDLRLEPEGGVGDAGRVVVAPSHRGALSQLVLTGLMARGWLEARALGFERVVGVASPQAIALYEGLGMRVAALGPPRAYWGEERQPIEILGATESAVSQYAPPAAEEEPAEEDDEGLSRRDLLVRVGGLSAGALVLVGVPTAAAGGPAGVGAGPTDRRTVEFVCQIDQVGAGLNGHGYLTHVKGLSDSVLFTRPLPTSGADPSTDDVETARFVLVIQAAIGSITAIGSAIAGHGKGTAEFRLLPGGGARLDDPASFGAGTTVATFAVEFQHNLAIDSPDRAIASFTADLTQKSARAFQLQGRTYQLGKAGLPWSVRASGRGVRTDPETPTSQHFVSGDMGVVDAVNRR
jgi:N-acyl-L-homoserine lactone synthetase